MNIEVDGEQHRVADENTLRPLLSVLREELGCTAAKAGCQEGSCGTCTVLVNGQPRRSCLLPVAAVDGAPVTTVAGIGDAADPHPVQEAFHERYGAQCGYCTPGMIMATVALLGRSPEPTDDEMVAAIDGHICRCTGYVKILDAIRTAAQSTVDGREVSR